MTEISKNFPLEISDYQYFLETSEHGLKCWKMFQQPLSIFPKLFKRPQCFVHKSTLSAFLEFFGGGGGDLIEFSLLLVIM